MSTDTTVCGRSISNCSSTGNSRACSSSALIGVAFGRVDSAPRSMMSAPPSTASTAAATAIFALAAAIFALAAASPSSGKLKPSSPSPEKLSGVTFTIAITCVRAPSASVRVRNCQSKCGL